MGDVDTPVIMVMIYTDENLFCKDDETHVFIETKKIYRYYAQNK